MDNEKDRLYELAGKYLNNQISSGEYQELWLLLNEKAKTGSLDKALLELWQAAGEMPALIADHTWDAKLLNVKEKLESAQTTGKTIQLQQRNTKRYWWAAAAVIFVLLMSSVFVFNTKDTRPATAEEAGLLNRNYDQLPGGDKAILTLADGSQIILDSTGNGLVAKQGNTEVIKNKDGQLSYTYAGGETEEVPFNLLKTPRGGQYKLILPDGSKVWLNAASSLKYPVAFTGSERRVEITGEAYFEIAKDVNKPFRVQLNNMEVEVLGTHFNINAYDDEESVRTTLLEGKVKIKAADQQQLLAPGQQARLAPGGKLKISNDVNLEETVAWKDGNFQFENSDIKSVMRQLARWYDVEVTYKGNVTKHFIGGISRNVKLSQVLLMLQQTGEVRFVTGEKSITVMP